MGFIFAGLVLCWLPTYLVGGAAEMPPLWFFVPILLAGVRFGYFGALLTAAASTFLAGPLTPDDVAHHTAQVPSDWLLRGAFFVGIGVVMASVTRRLQDEAAINQLARERSERAAAELDRQRVLQTITEQNHREFTETLQVARTEREAHEIVRRHVERTVPHAAVIVLNRNNSDDRLDAATDVPQSSSLTSALKDARPESCLAIRFGRAYECSGEREPLLTCEVCGHTTALSTCIPSLVGGRVIGSVLVEHDQPLDPDAAQRIREAVSQSAPVLANLRTLVIAETRAATDALTGLPNRRSVEDTLRRLVAQASRTLEPLSAVLVDLDHFKSINDRHGHGRGDDALAAVGDVLRAESRASDFAGRYGGEEFILLLPNTDVSGAETLAANIKLHISQISLPEATDALTASFGIATIPAHATDGETLIRNADRALYCAKQLGRNRVEVATTVQLPDPSPRSR